MRVADAEDEAAVQHDDGDDGLEVSEAVPACMRRGVTGRTCSSPAAPPRHRHDSRAMPEQIATRAGTRHHVNPAGSHSGHTPGRTCWVGKGRPRQVCAHSR